MSKHDPLSFSAPRLELSKKNNGSGTQNDFRKFTILFFFAHPLHVLIEILDPSKATSARPRKLGLRPQTVRVRPAGRCLRPRRVPQNFVGPLRGRAGFGVKIRIKASCWFPCENLAGRPSPRVKHFGLSEPEGRACGQRLRVHSASAGCFRNVPRTTEHGVKNFRRVPFFGSPFLGTQER